MIEKVKIILTGIIGLIGVNISDNIVSDTLGTTIESIASYGNAVHQIVSAITSIIIAYVTIISIKNRSKK